MTDLEFYSQDLGIRELEKLLEVFIYMKFPQLSELSVDATENNSVKITFKGSVKKEEIELELEKLKAELSQPYVGYKKNIKR